MIEQKATDQDGRIVFTADHPINGSYYVKEMQAPAGFVTTEEVKEFDFAYICIRYNSIFFLRDCIGERWISVPEANLGSERGGIGRAYRLKASGNLHFCALY